MAYDIEANNGCYKRIYVNDIKGLVVADKEIPDLDSIQGTDLADTAKEDVFGNSYYDFNKLYQKRRVDNTPVTPDEYKRCTYTPELVNGEWKGVECANPSGDTISSFESPDSCSIWVEPDSRLLWIRHDKDCNPVTTENPNATRSVYKQRDHIRTDYGRFENGEWVTKPIDITCEPLNPITTVTLEATSVGDWEFSYENGVLMAREEGYTDYLEPENNTVIYTVNS